MNDLIRVSDVLRPYQDWSAVPDRYMEPALERGSIVHLWCRNYALKIWMPVSLDQYRGYIESFRGWFDRYVQKVFFVENRFDDPDLGFTGQPDLGCILRGETDPLIVDYKTSAMTQKVWLCQVSAYIELARKNGIPVKRGGSLKLNGEGRSAKFVPVDYSAEAFSIFLSALNAHRWLKGDNHGL